MVMAIVISLKVVPHAARTRVARDASGIIKCYVKAPAIDGKANEALIELLHKLTGLARSTIKIVSGHTSRLKKVSFTTTMRADELLLLIVGEEQRRLL
jgi:uncharacterized protein (TIGR00251 family)